jgi:hypothetical protein
MKVLRCEYDESTTEGKAFDKQKFFIKNLIILKCHETNK